MLLMKPSCQCCDRDLLPDSTAAVICGFEVTWCGTCAQICRANVCPNFGATGAASSPGSAALGEHPASTERVHPAGLHRGN